MKASTLFLGFTLVVLAAALAGLWQAFGPRPAPHPKAVAVAPPTTEAPKRPPPEPPPVVQPEPNPPDDGVRTVYPGARPSAARPPQPETSPPALITPPPEPAPSPVPISPPSPDRSAALPPPGPPPASEPIPADPGGEGVDLNTASVEALNNLGAGKIAKSVIANRPYTAPDDLVTRRILKRKDFDAIKSHIVVR